MVQVLGDDLKSECLPLPLVLASLHKGNVLDRDIRNKQTKNKNANHNQTIKEVLWVASIS